MGLAKAQNKKKINFFGKKLPAWVLLAALVAVGAGAATGLVLKDSISGTTTIAVSQAIAVTGLTGGGDADEFLGTVDDDGMTWAAHFEANNGDTLTLVVQIDNLGSDTVDSLVVCQLDLDIPDGISVSINAADTADTNDVTQVGPSTWKFAIDDNDSNDLTLTLALEDALPTGFYTITGVVVPLNS